MEVINIQKKGGGVRQRRERRYDVTVICKTSLGKKVIKVTGHPFWRFEGNRYCAFKISPIFIQFSPNVRQFMHNMVEL
jgi:hypothetical protein